MCRKLLYYTARKINVKYSKINIKYYRNETNVGGGESRNIGIRNSTGDYIAFLDSDDIWESTKLQKANEMECEILL